MEELWCAGHTAHCQLEISATQVPCSAVRGQCCWSLTYLYLYCLCTGESAGEDIAERVHRGWLDMSAWLINSVGSTQCSESCCTACTIRCYFTCQQLISADLCRHFTCRQLISTGLCRRFTCRRLISADLCRRFTCRQLVFSMMLPVLLFCRALTIFHAHHRSVTLYIWVPCLFASLQVKWNCTVKKGNISGTFTVTQGRI